MAQKARFGEIVVVEYPYSDGRRGKFRPALTLSSHEDGDLLIARITSKFMDGQFDIPLLDWKNSGLMAPSTVRLEKMTTLLSERVKAKVGDLSERDKKKIVAGLHAFIDSLD